MRHHNKNKKFGRVRKQRTALMRSLARSLILHDRIKTTEAKAKAVKGQVEKLVTVSKRGESALYHLKKDISEDAVVKLIKEIGPRFLKRPGGYTRIVKLGSRGKDNADMALLEFVEKGAAQRALPGGRKNKKTKKSAVKKDTKKGIKSILKRNVGKQSGPKE